MNRARLAAMGLLILAAAGLGGQASVPAPAPVPSPAGAAVEAFQDWKKTCESAPDRKSRVCFGFQKVSYEVTKARLLQAVVGYFRADTKDPTLIVTVPLGAYLVPGLQIRAGAGAPIRADFQYCFSNGCQAAIRLDAARLARLSGLEKAEVVFLDAGHQRLSVPLSLKGFGALLKALQTAGSRP